MVCAFVIIEDFYTRVHGFTSGGNLECFKRSNMVARGGGAYMRGRGLIVGGLR